jgi:hypothetical protein
VRLAFVLLFACGPRGETPTTDFGPPAQPIDPIACPAARLERFAETAELTIILSTEAVVDAGRVDKAPCKTDEQCISRARKRPAPAFYEITGVTIGADNTQVDYTYDLDGRRIIEQADSMAQMVERLKALQAAGHTVTLLHGDSAPDAGPRHAAITYRGIGGTDRHAPLAPDETGRRHPRRAPACARARSGPRAGAARRAARDRHVERSHACHHRDLRAIMTG